MSLCLELCNSVHCVFLDFAKAFDSVAHEHLLIKLQGIGINGELLQWIRSFLTHRLQRVVSGAYSDWLSVRSGAPQGSVLGPLLFLLYIDDLHSIVRHSKLKLYADDVTLYQKIKSEADCQLLQEWQLHLNVSKCEALLISNKHKAISFEYFVNHSPLAWRSTVKYLEVLLHSNLSWSDHCKHVSAKARSKSSDVCLQELHWPTLSSRRNYLSVTMMYDILHGRYDSLKLSDYCKSNTSCTRAHSMTLVPPQSTINSYQFSFFVNTTFLWNTVPYDVVSLSAPKFR